MSENSIFSTQNAKKVTKYCYRSCFMISERCIIQSVFNNEMNGQSFLHTLAQGRFICYIQ